MYLKIKINVFRYLLIKKKKNRPTPIVQDYSVAGHASPHVSLSATAHHFNIRSTGGSEDTKNTFFGFFTYDRADH
jgi:hypothetical protein